MSFKLPTDFFKWYTFAIAVIKLIIKVFGDDGAKTELKKNGFDD